MQRAMMAVVVSSAVLSACTAQPPGEPPDDPSAGSAETSAGPPTDSLGGTTVDVSSSGSTTMPMPPGDSTSAGSSDTEPGFYFDLGVIPDMPEGKLPGCQQAVDIVFTMDVSTTMGGFIMNLADEILEVDAAISALDLPLQPHYGLAVFVDDALLVNGGAPYTDAMVLRDDFLMWSAFTASNQQVGGGNSNTTFAENSTRSTSRPTSSSGAPRRPRSASSSTPPTTPSGTGPPSATA